MGNWLWTNCAKGVPAKQRQPVMSECLMSSVRSELETAEDHGLNEKNAQTFLLEGETPDFMSAGAHQTLLAPRVMAYKVRWHTPIGR